MTEYIPQISQILLANKIISKPLTFTIRKGKNNYICDRKYKSYSKAKFKAEKNLLDFNEYMDKDRLFEVDELHLTEHDKKRVCVTECYSQCEFKENCRYKNFVKEVVLNKYDFQIVNHNYLIADVLIRKKVDRSLLSEFGQVIVDEAHKLPSTINDMYGKSISENEVERYLKIIANVRKVSIGNYEKTLELNKDIFEIIKSNTDSLFIIRKELRYDLEKMIKYLRRDIKPIRKIALKNYDAEKFVRKFDDLITKFEELATPDLNIVWTEKEKQINKVSFLSKKLKEEINKDLWSLSIPTILTSGTISIDGDFTHLEEKLALESHKQRIVTTNTYSPFNFNKQAILYMPRNMPQPNYDDTNYQKEVADEIEKIVRVTHGHTLILFTSYNFLDNVFYEMQSKNLPYPLLKMTKGKLNVIDEFKNSKNGVLFASDAAGEGIDIAGDVLSSVIVVRLPFPVRNAMSEYERQMKNDHDQFMQKDVVPQMIIKLRQWIGRGIRRETDTCAFSILDPRASGRYRETILNALPEMPVTRCRTDVSQFILDNKTVDYFD